MSHFVTHPGTPQKYVTFCSRPSTKNPDKSLLYEFPLNCSRGCLSGGCVFVRGVLSGGLLSRFCPECFLSVPPSVRIYLLQQKVKHHLKFHVSLCMIKIFISMTSLALELSQVVTPPRTPSPSSVTCFMDGP